MRSEVQRSRIAIDWIETACVEPTGPNKGEHAFLTLDQRHIVRMI
jgi:hypothetical protein